MIISKSKTSKQVVSQFSHLIHKLTIHKHNTFKLSFFMVLWLHRHTYNFIPGSMQISQLNVFIADLKRYILS